MIGTGVPGSPLSITTQINNGGERRSAVVTVTAGSQTRELVVTQLPVLTQLRGTRVIECFGRFGYVDVYRNATTTTIENVGGGSARRPIWNFVHIVDNDFAIRNDTTGRYLTETNGSLRHEARISGTSLNYNNRQRWRMVAQADGSYRIRSVSSPTSYVTDGARLYWQNPVLSLATLNTSHNRQSWWIGYIWHQGTRYENWVGFWCGAINDGAINIRVEPIVLQPATGFNFEQRMIAAKNARENALGITFNTVADMEDANIRAYGGDRREIAREIGLLFVRSERYGVVIPPARGFGRVTVGTIQAGGVTRDVDRLNGTGNRAMRMLVFSDDARRINFATMTAMHELGHALGYWGHSPNSNDVMTGSPAWLPWGSPNENLNPAEIEHLRQIYRRFRS